MGDQINPPERLAWAIRERDDSQSVTGDPILASRARGRGLSVVELIDAAAYEQAIRERDEARTARDYYDRQINAIAPERDRLREDLDRLRDNTIRDPLSVYHEAYELRAERDRYREAITDALADLTPGISPYSVLDNALRGSAPSVEGDGGGPCAACDGSGNDARCRSFGAPGCCLGCGRVCTACSGTGSAGVQSTTETATGVDADECPHCDGSGDTYGRMPRYSDRRCKTCGGTGSLPAAPATPEGPDD